MSHSGPRYEQVVPERSRRIVILLICSMAC